MTGICSRRAWRVSLAASAAFFATDGARAQEVRAPSEIADEQQSSSSSTSDIVVTAQRRTERLQDVPVTVTAFAAEEIQEARILDIGDIATRTPGLSFDAFPTSQPRLAVRGVGSSDRGAAGDPSSAVFLDEVYLGRPAAVAVDPFDLERIEVVKGPQGTLYGRNVVGGAVNFITRRPNFTEARAGAEASYGNFDRLDLAGFVNLPFGQNSGAIRASGAYRSQSGYALNTFTGNRVDDQDTLSGRLQFAGQPNSTFRFNLTLDGTRDRATGPAQHVLDLDESDPFSALWTVDRDRDRTAGSTDGRQNRDTFGVRTELVGDFDFASLTFLGSYRVLDYDAFYDFDGGNPDINLVDIAGGNVERSEFSSQELRLSSPSGSSIQWVAGLYHFFMETKRQDTLALDLGPFGGPGTEIFDQDATIDSVAAFADATLPIGNRFAIIGGVRYTRDKKRYSVNNILGDAVFRSSEQFDTTNTVKYDALTWRAGVNFKPSSDHLIYSMVSRGFKSGGFQDTPDSAADAATPFAPEYATQYEIGQKSSFFSGRVIWNNTFFYVDYTNLQTRVTNGLSVITQNAGEATIKGYETYLSFRPSKGLQLVASYAYTDARFDRYIASPTENFSGNRISRTPEHKVVISPSYTLGLASGASIRLATDYRFESRIFDDNSNTGPEQRDPTHFVDARLVFRTADDKLSISVWGKNLTNEDTRVFQAVFLGANFGSYNPPRTYGATVGVNF
jgi:iron complex outermembrane recepter protein